MNFLQHSLRCILFYIPFFIFSEKLYKKANVGNAKAKTRAQTRVTRNQKKEMLGFARRGIPDSFSDEEPEANENEGITRKSQRSLKKQEKQKGLQDRLKRLEEFRKQKQEKKVTDAKNKRPPFKTGVYHGFGKFDANSGFNNPWVKTNLKKGQVFVFKGNQGTTKSSQVIYSSLRITLDYFSIAS